MTKPMPSDPFLRRGIANGLANSGAETSNGASSGRSESDPAGGRIPWPPSHASDEDVAAVNEIIPLVYDDLRRIAHRQLSCERAGHTLSTTAVVHEAYVRLVDQTRVTWRSRAHFFAVAARIIRRVLVDYARNRDAQKRGGGAILIPLREDVKANEPRVLELLVLDQALSRLAQQDPRLEHIVECRFFGGMTMNESAAAMGVSRRTAERDWTRAKAYLLQALEDDPSSGGSDA